MASSQVHHVQLACLGCRYRPFDGSAGFAPIPHSLFALIRALAEVGCILPAHFGSEFPFPGSRRRSRINTVGAVIYYGGEFPLTQRFGCYRHLGRWPFKVLPSCEG
jgi:hypothetical protein